MHEYFLSSAPDRYAALATSTNYNSQEAIAIT